MLNKEAITYNETYDAIHAKRSELLTYMLRDASEGRKVTHLPKMAFKVLDVPYGMYETVKGPLQSYMTRLGFDLVDGDVCLNR